MCDRCEKAIPEFGLDVSQQTGYKNKTCPYCKRAKDYLSQKEIPYIDYNVAQDRDKASEMIQKSGQMGVPVIIVDNEVIIGFNQTKLDLGEPIIASVDARKSGSIYSFNQIIKGRLNEHIEMTRNGARPRAPKLNIKNKDGTYDRTFSFEYG